MALDAHELVVLAANSLRRAAVASGTNDLGVLVSTPEFGHIMGMTLTVMGVQPRPTSTLRSWRTMPRRPRIGDTPLLLAYMVWPLAVV